MFGSNFLEKIRSKIEILPKQQKTVNQWLMSLQKKIFVWKFRAVILISFSALHSMHFLITRIIVQLNPSLFSFSSHRQGRQMLNSEPQTLTFLIIKQFFFLFLIYFWLKYSKFNHRRSYRWNERDIYFTLLNGKRANFVTELS